MLTLARELLLKYSNCKSSTEVVAVQAQYIQDCEDETNNRQENNYGLLLWNWWLIKRDDDLLVENTNHMSLYNSEGESDFTDSEEDEEEQEDEDEDEEQEDEDEDK